MSHDRRPFQDDGPPTASTPVTKPPSGLNPLTGEASPWEELYQAVLRDISEAILLTDDAGNFTYVCPNVEAVFGYSAEEIQAFGTIRQFFSDRGSDLDAPDRLGETCSFEQDISHKTGQRRRLLVQVKQVAIAAGTRLYLCRDVTTERQQVLSLHQQAKVELAHRAQVEAALRQQMERERIVSAIAYRIHHSLDLDIILKTTVAEIRDFLDTDRVLIYRFEPDWSGVIVVESVVSPWTPVLGRKIHDPCFTEQYVEFYRQGRVQAIQNIHTANLQSCHFALLKSLQVCANLVVPIVSGNQLWGLLIAHHCRAPRSWQPSDLELLLQLANQTGIAIQQAELYQQVQQLNTNLEAQVERRTAQLRQALEFELLLQRITTKVRDSLDEDLILQTAVEELALGLNLDSCDAAFYNSNQDHLIVAYEYVCPGFPLLQGKTTQMSNESELFVPLSQGALVYFCFLPFGDPLRPIPQRVTVLGCPLIDDQGVLGDLWLYKSEEADFSAPEMRLAQQVANHCAIALRQARLYEAAQAQVRELERLNRLKDDFLNTVSHELRTPMSSIQMATQMLEISLQDAGALDAADSKVARYFDMLQAECIREISLINDLLDLSRLDAGTEPLTPTTIDPRIWIAHIAEPFVRRTQSQQQTLHLDLPASMPALTTDLSYLERILSELLHNACKYTPPGERIVVAVRMVGSDGGDGGDGEVTSPSSSPLPSHSFLQVRICNSGVEIPEAERDRIFDKFYRIPSNDPWKHGGTGLGLALVKKLVEHLQGTIRVESRANQVAFIVELPFAMWN